MDSAHTLSILRDIYLVSYVALGIAVALYAYLRIHKGLSWNTQGNVLTRPYEWNDGVLALVLMSGLVLMSLQPSQGPPKFEDFNTTAYAAGLFVSSLFMPLVAVGVIIYLTVFRQMNPAEMFGLRQMSIWKVLGVSVLWLVGGGFLMYLLVFGVTEWFHLGLLEDEEPQAMVQMFQDATNPWLKVAIMVAAVIFAPFAEEVLFRGFFYGVTKRFTERWFATIFTSVIFACVHVHLGSFLPLMLLGVLFAWAYERTGSLFVPMFMHAIFNGLNALKMLFPNLGE